MANTIERKKTEGYSVNEIIEVVKCCPSLRVSTEDC